MAERGCHPPTQTGVGATSRASARAITATGVGVGVATSVGAANRAAVHLEEQALKTALALAACNKSASTADSAAPQAANNPGGRGPYVLV